MGPLFEFLFLASLAVWLGSIVFFGFIAAPEISGGGIAQDQALRVLSRISASYLTLSWVCGAVVFVSVFFLPAADGSYVTVRIVLALLMFLFSLYLAFGVGARIRRAQRTLDAAAEGEVPKEAMADFDAFQSTASQLGGALLLLGFVVVFITAFYA